MCDLLACDACVAISGVESSQHCDANVEKTLLHMSLKQWRDQLQASTRATVREQRAAE